MKRKIQHNAINNQEDEDSSINPIWFMNEDSSDSKEKESVENSAVHLSSEVSDNNEELTK